MSRKSIIIRSIIAIIVAFITLIISSILLLSDDVLWRYPILNVVVRIYTVVCIASLAFIIGVPKWKTGIKIWIMAILIMLIVIVIPYTMYFQDQKSKVNTSVNIDVNEYLPFDANSKIIRINNSSLHLESDLPRLDGAAAVFPVYSAFVNAVYPDTVKLGDEAFVYNNTVSGYYNLVSGETDIFFGAYPSEEQIAYAEKCGKEFKYTQIGSEAFVFFVNTNCSVDNLTQQQIKDIYSGKVTNWKEVGGDDLEIVAYQRNQGSGSQSMLERFMGDAEIVDAPKEQINDWMMGIANVVATYRSNPKSIGFSFRYYIDTLVNNPDLKMLSVDGVYPSIENIENGSYPIVTPLYAVTCKDNTNPNIQVLLDWILSAEGQEIIERTGYAGVGK